MTVIASAAKQSLSPCSAGGNTKGGDFIPMTPEEESIWHMIQGAPGSEKAIPSKTIELFTGISGREIRTIVRRLRVVFHCPVGSSTGKHSGYFLATSMEELKAVADTWYNFGIQQLIMALKLMKFPPDEFLNQIRLDLAGSGDIDGTDNPLRHIFSGSGDIPVAESPSPSAKQWGIKEGSPDPLITEA